MAFKDELKLGRAGLEQALAAFLAALELEHVAGDPESGPTELQHDRIKRIAFDLNRILQTGGTLEVVEKAQAGRSKMPS